MLRLCSVVAFCFWLGYYVNIFFRWPVVYLSLLVVSFFVCWCIFLKPAFDPTSAQASFLLNRTGKENACSQLHCADALNLNLGALIYNYPTKQV